MQALAAVQQRYADAPDAFVDLALADGVALFADQPEFLLQLVDTLGGEFLGEVQLLAPFVLQVR